MLKKTICLVITFRETVQALAAEKHCLEHSLPGRLIPVPRDITAGCGLSWKASAADKETLCASFDAAGIKWEQTYILEI